MAQNIEAFERAMQVFTALKRSPEHQHGGENSRGIKVNPPSVLERIHELSRSYPSPDVRLPILRMQSLLDRVSFDYNALNIIVVCSPDKRIFISIRGETGPISDKMTYEEIIRVDNRRRGVNISVSASRRSEIFADPDDPFPDYTDFKFGNEINHYLSKLQPEQRTELGDKFIDIVAEAVGENGRFPDLVGLGR